MINPVIYEGLIQAMQRGEPLQKAMASFLNAGYPRNEIEEAARALQMNQPPQQPRQIQQYQPPKKPIKNVIQKPTVPTIQKPSQLPSQSNSIPEENQPQEEKIYEVKQKPKIDAVLITMIAIVILLLALLSIVFIFKSDIIQFLTNLF